MVAKQFRKEKYMIQVGNMAGILREIEKISSEIDKFISQSNYGNGCHS